MTPSTISPDIKKELDEQGFAKSGDIGGQPKTHYWTPDGRSLWVAPSWHEFAKRDSTGKILESGVRDANLDKGWLMQKPTILKLYCGGCDCWHDTEKEVNECEAKRNDRFKVWGDEHVAYRRNGKNIGVDEETNRLTQVEKDVGEIKDMLTKLLERG